MQSTVWAPSTMNQKSCTHVWCLLLDPHLQIRLQRSRQCIQAERRQQPPPEAPEEGSGLWAAVRLVEVGEQQAGVARRHKGRALEHCGLPQFSSSPQQPLRPCSIPDTKKRPASQCRPHIALTDLAQAGTTFCEPWKHHTICNAQ